MGYDATGLHTWALFCELPTANYIKGSTTWTWCPCKNIKVMRQKLILENVHGVATAVETFSCFHEMHKGGVSVLKQLIIKPAAV